MNSYTSKQQRILNGVHHKIELLREQEQQTKRTLARPFKKYWAVPVAVGAMALLIALLAANPFLGQQFDEAAPQQLADAGGGYGEHSAAQEEAELEAMPEDGAFYARGGEDETEQFFADSYGPANPEGTNSAFSLALLNASLQEKKGSVAISPAAAELSLLMLYTEAYGETQQALAGVLHIHSEAEALVRAAAIQHAFSRNAGQLDIWLSLGGKSAFDAEFAESAREYFGAQTDDESAQSHEKQLEDAGHAELTVFNAANMRSDAENSAADDTSDGHTETDGQTERLHPIIEEMDYAYLDGLHYVALPYTQNSRIMLVLPQEGTDVQTAAGIMAQAGLEAMLDNMERQTIRLLMPDFDISSDTDLALALQGMGLGRLFDEERCELNLTQEGAGGGVYVGQMMQSCGVGLRKAGAETLEPKDAVFSMALHEPFLYVVYSEEGMVLACGSAAGAHE
ncbi:MAG: serpin family protein [Christensenellales bacterium]